MIRNLISISRLDVYDFMFQFENNELRLYHNSMYIESELLCDNLYKLCLDYSFFEFLLSSNVTNGIKRNHDSEYSFKLRNYRLGHILRDIIQHLIKTKILSTLDFSDFDSCIECVKRKFVKGNKKGPFQVSDY
jgi:GAG-pre-integrase domain